MTALCPECLCIWARHQSHPVPGVGFTPEGRPISGLPRDYCPDHKATQTQSRKPKPKKGKR